LDWLNEKKRFKIISEHSDFIASNVHLTLINNKITGPVMLKLLYEILKDFGLIYQYVETLKVT